MLFSDVRFAQVCGRSSEGESGRAEVCILRSAVRLFGRHGYSGTSVRAIADAAGVTAPLIGYHFGSKEGLFATCVALVYDGLVGAIRFEVDRARTLEALVREFAAVQIRFTDEFPEAVRFALSIAYGPEEAQPEVEIVASWAALHDAVVLRFDESIRAGEFVPRPGASVHDVVRSLFKMVHLEVFSAYERERFAGQLAGHRDLHKPPADPVADIVHQFFHGAGELRAEHPIREEKDS